MFGFDGTGNNNVTQMRTGTLSGVSSFVLGQGSSLNVYGTVQRSNGVAGITLSDVVLVDGGSMSISGSASTVFSMSRVSLDRESSMSFSTGTVLESNDVDIQGSSTIALTSSNTWTVSGNMTLCSSCSISGNGGGLSRSEGGDGSLSGSQSQAGATYGGRGGGGSSVR